MSAGKDSSLKDRKYLEPIELVKYLDEYVVGQDDAKRSISIALRNRYRRLELRDQEIFDEISPKNILFIGDTGVGKTEIVIRVADSHDFPFIKVDATKYTEVGYVGHDVESIIKDLVENRIKVLQSRFFSQNNDFYAKKAMRIILDALVKQNNSYSLISKEDLEKMYQDGSLDDVKILMSLPEKPSNKSIFDIIETSSISDRTRSSDRDQSGVGVFAITDIVGFGSHVNKSRSPKQLYTISHCRNVLIEEERSKDCDNEDIKHQALKDVEESGVVFIDEIDKLITKSSFSRGEVSREGVQRDLIPLMSGCYINTKYGSIKTHNILFVAAGAFHNSDPVDLMPELQGRMPVQIRLKSLTQDDFYKILTHPKYSIIKQVTSLLNVDKISLEFTECGLRHIAKIAYDMNRDVRNTGARRLYSIVEKIGSDVGFNIPKSVKKFVIDEAFVTNSMSEMILEKNIKKENYVI